MLHVFHRFVEHALHISSLPVVILKLFSQVQHHIVMHNWFHTSYGDRISCAWSSGRFGINCPRWTLNYLGLGVQEDPLTAWGGALLKDLCLACGWCR